MQRRLVSALCRAIQPQKCSGALLHHLDVSLRGGQRPTWRPEREARGSALGVQFRSTWPDNRKVSGEYGTVTRRGVEDAATYKVCAVGDGLHEPQVPSRDCHVALLLAMTHQAGAAVTTVHPIKLVLLIAASRAWLSPLLH